MDDERRPDAPGDLTRGTQQESTPSGGASAPSQDRSVAFAERQSFADPVHKQPDQPGLPGGIRTQESGSQEGSDSGSDDALALAAASEEE